MKLPVNRIEDGNGYVTTTSMMFDDSELAKKFFDLVITILKIKNRLQYSILIQGKKLDCSYMVTYNQYYTLQCIYNKGTI